MIIKEYLSEKNLGVFLSERFEYSYIHNRMIKEIPNYRKKPDYRFEEIKCIVEFDGFGHYTDPIRILNDRDKDRVYKSYGYDVIRIPYFVQLSENVVLDLFGKYIKNTSAFNDYPHGFISDDVKFPSHFCEIGLLRFLNDLEKFSYISEEIINSLRNAIEKYSKWELIIPPSLKNIL
ncbi:MAG: hypothetical protein WC284_16290 [Candidimonas sp.]